MSISSVGTRSSLLVQSLVTMRAQLDELTRQLGTGKKSTTYAGLGVNRGLSVSLRSELSAINAYTNTITMVGTRIGIAQTALSRIDDIARSTKSTLLLSASSLDGGGQTVDQKTAYGQLDEILALLNTQAGDRYLFSGKSVDQPAVETADHIVNGDGARAGLKKIIDERLQADVGSNGLGRLVVDSPSSTAVSIAEDVAGSPFGFKLAGVASSLTGASVTGPGGSSAGISVDLGTTNPNEGDTIKFSFTLPDGSTENLTLTATSANPPGENEFTIGTTVADTAENLRSALNAGVNKLAGTALTAASAIAASNNFFNADASHPPQRIAGPPFDTATALIDGTNANTVIWYTGEAGSDSARSTAAARIDSSISVAYGMRANEDALRSVVQNIAVFAAMSFSPDDPNAGTAYTALAQRVGSALGADNHQKVTDIEAELAGAQRSLSAAADRQKQTQNTLTDLLQGVEGVSDLEVAAQILSLQTRLEASLQTTSLLYRMSLVNYL